MLLSVIVITYNEEKNIAACLESVAWADEIIVVDSKSPDRTVEIARQYTEHVYSTDFMGYAANKNFALAHASGDWVLWLDADERVTPELAQEIRHTLDQPSAVHGYEISRKAFFLGRWIRHCGWYPGYVLRLFRRESGRFNDRKVHEGLELSGERRRLHNDLLHFTDMDLEHYFDKFNQYTSLAAEDLADKQRHARLWDLLLRPTFLFIKMYLFKRGFLDGVQGWMLCLLSSAYVAVKYAKLWELNHSESGAMLPR
ncbi:MAG TPA: glycosyltransferase family 2 protein [bacterium]|nr:glycosyltransferase family 2 protein [bacterium]HPG46604.1 glycosyltransferase family 2 protein [bacterium]HPM98340.1 glycosyltransferase family 2 protein [bacterium]